MQIVAIEKLQDGIAIIHKIIEWKAGENSFDLILRYRFSILVNITSIAAVIYPTSNFGCNRFTRQLRFDEIEGQVA